MLDFYLSDHTFSKIRALEKGEYENCVFKNCDFAEQSLAEYSFVECEFIACNLSLIKLYKTTFRDVVFQECKMLGLRFETCNPFGLSFSFDGCQLNHASFYKTKIANTVFKNCSLQETDFSESDISNAVFDECNLQNAVFENTNLAHADLRTSYNFSIDPETNSIKKAKFSLPGVLGLLHKHDIDIES